ncbi:hypothetical protein BZA05DRAFT_422762 [Tricharina praecox]|uniref:uncharacterized protein n=1 Tax=Tricharina praecox TaxID=43433 RepID=UPI00221F4B8B|nr:uncharacterized protein BZA05DRAFT_422762 [Tricharina praecox]KAI5841681.1 hypothetical protein BZA05DRAFT_422762 [Tricharina praecox]
MLSSAPRFSPSPFTAPTAASISSQHFHSTVYLQRRWSPEDWYLRLKVDIQREFLWVMALSVILTRFDTCRYNVLLRPTFVGPFPLIAVQYAFTRDRQLKPSIVIRNAGSQPAVMVLRFRLATIENRILEEIRTGREQTW